MPPISSESFAERLHLTRASRGLSQIGLAAMAGITQQQLSLYEKAGATPRTRVVMNLAASLGVRHQWLASGEGPQVEEHDGFDPRTPRVITKITPEGRTQITIVVSDELRAALVKRANAEGHMLDAFISRVVRDLGEEPTAS